MSTPKYYFSNPVEFRYSESCPYPPTLQRLTSSVRLIPVNSPVPGLAKENPKTEAINNIYSIFDRNYNLTTTTTSATFPSRGLSLPSKSGDARDSVGLSPGNIHPPVPDCAYVYHINLLFGTGKS